VYDIGDDEGMAGSKHLGPDSATAMGYWLASACPPKPIVGVDDRTNELIGIACEAAAMNTSPEQCPSTNVRVTERRLLEGDKLPERRQ
jgi:hypothetical protein